MLRRKSIWAFYAYQATRSYGLYLPYSVLFLDQQGLGLDAIALVQAAFMVAVVGGEIPTGYVADRFGRRTSFGLASLLASVSLLAYPYAGSPAVYAMLLGGMGLALTLVTGAADAWLYELLDAEGADEEFARIKGRRRPSGSSLAPVGHCSRSHCTPRRPVSRFWRTRASPRSASPSWRRCLPSTAARTD